MPYRRARLALRVRASKSILHTKHNHTCGNFLGTLYGVINILDSGAQVDLNY